MKETIQRLKSELSLAKMNYRAEASEANATKLQDTEAALEIAKQVSEGKTFEELISQDSSEDLNTPVAQYAIELYKKAVGPSVETNVVAELGKEEPKPEVVASIEETGQQEKLSADTIIKAIKGEKKEVQAVSSIKENVTKTEETVQKTENTVTDSTKTAIDVVTAQPETLPGIAIVAADEAKQAAQTANSAALDAEDAASDANTAAEVSAENAEAAAQSADIAVNAADQAQEAAVEAKEAAVVIKKK